MNRPLCATHPAVEDLWNRDVLLPRGYGISVLFAAAMLAAVWAGGDDRFSGASFSALRTLGGWPLDCGVLAVLLAALLVARCVGPRMLCWALYAAGGIDLLFAISFFVSALESPVAATTGPPAYIALAAFHISHAIAYQPCRGRP